jgi:hypothetical protein
MPTRTANAASTPAAISAACRSALDNEKEWQIRDIKLGDEQNAADSQSLRGVVLVRPSGRVTICHGQAIYTGGRR